MKKIKKCSGLWRFAHLHMFSSPPWMGWHSLISPQTETCLSQKAPRYISWICPTYRYYTTESNKQYWLFPIIFGWPWLLCNNFKNLCCLGSIQEAVGPVAWLLNTLCLLKNEIYIGCIPEVNIMTSFTLSKWQPCQTHNSQYPTVHPFSTGA